MSKHKPGQLIIRRVNKTYILFIIIEVRERKFSHTIFESTIIDSYIRFDQFMSSYDYVPTQGWQIEVDI